MDGDLDDVNGKQINVKHESNNTYLGGEEEENEDDDDVK